MSSPEDTPRPLSADDALPPVEPPSAGFIVKLFVVPGLIVVIIVAVWLLFNWLAQMGNDPQQYIEALRRDNEARWQAAVNLADALRDERNDELKHDAVTAQQLSAILEEELVAAEMESNAVTLRIFLCRALGEFHVPNVLPALLKAANTQRDSEEAAVRRAAIESIAVLLGHLPELADNPPPELVETLLTAAREPDAQGDEGRGRMLRSTAAFTLGVMGGPRAQRQLQHMLADSYPDVRYNAATGLARQGDLAAVDVLIAMLDPEQVAGTEVEQQEAAREYKRQLILVNALRAVQQLAAKNPEADLSGLRAAVENLLEADVPPEIQLQAKEVLQELNAS